MIRSGIFIVSLREGLQEVETNYVTTLNVNVTCIILQSYKRHSKLKVLKQQKTTGSLEYSTIKAGSKAHCVVKSGSDILSSRVMKRARDNRSPIAATCVAFYFDTPSSPEVHGL